MQTALRLFIIFTAAISAIALTSLIFGSSMFSSIYFGAGITAFALLAIAKPVLAISLFLFLLPVFGNKPGTLQSHHLLVIGLALQSGLAIKLLFRRSYKTNLSSLAPGFLYTLISILSLIPVSLLIFTGWFRASQTELSNLALLSWNISSILLSREDDPGYPVLSVLWTSLAFSLAYFTALTSTLQPASRKIFCWSLLAGFIVSLLVGLLNYYGLLSLDLIRGLDPVVNPGGTQYRLQSWFGHSGWYAEYVTMLAPFAMLFLTLSIAFWWRVSILICLLLIGELVLILTFQRGGWLSYPLTLLAIWTSIYVIRRLDRGDSIIFKAFKASALKIAISLPLTLLVSFLIIRSFGSQLGLDQYAGRFKDITKASDRTEFIKAGFALGTLYPILGLGSESFALQYRREYREPDGNYFGQIDLPLHGTAHNLYAQTFAGKGLLGLLSFLLVLFCSVKSGIRFVFNSVTLNSRSDQIIALACICSLLACFIYGFVQELFYVQSLQYVFFAVVGILASLQTQSTAHTNTIARRGMYVALLLAASFFAHLALYLHSSRPYSDSTGCYTEETNSAGERWRWCGVRSSIDIPVTELSSKILKIETAPPSNSESKKELIRIVACERDIFSSEMARAQRAEVNLPEEILNCPQSRPGFIRFKAYAGGFYIPAMENKASTDRRVLALRWVF